MTIEAAAAGLKWASLAKITGQGITWVITLIVIRVLNPADYGVAAVAAVFVALLASIAELGLGAAVVQARSIEEAETGRIAAAAIVLNVACAAIIVLLSPLIALAYDDSRIGSIVAVLSLSLMFNGIATVPESILYREMCFKRLAAIDIVSAAIGSVATLIMALSGCGVWALVLGSVAGTVARSAALVKFSRWVRPRFALDGLSKHLRFGGALTAGRLAWQVAQQCDVLIGGRFLSEAALGLYSVSIHLARLPMHKAMSVINQVAFPAVARLQDDRQWLSARIIDAIGLLGLFVVPLLWGLSSVAPDFVVVVLGEQWISASSSLQVAALAIPVQLLSNVLSTTLVGLGRADVELRNMLSTLVVTVVAVVIGARAGAVGLAAGWGVAMILAFALNFRRTNQVIGLPVRDGLRVLRGPVIAGACMYLAVSGARMLPIDIRASIRLPVLILVGAVVYLAAVTMLDRNAWPLLRRVFQKVRTA